MDGCESHDEFYSSENSNSEKEHEFELYSVLHYNSMSKDLPPSVLEKYNIKRNNKNEFYISLKNTKNSITEDQVLGETTVVNTGSGNTLAISKNTPPNHSCESPHDSLSIIYDTPPDSNNERISLINGVVKQHHYSFNHLFNPGFARDKEEDHTTLTPSPDVISISDIEITSPDVISISDIEIDSDSDSDVIIQEPVYEVLNLLSSSSSVECLSDSDSGDNLMINTVNKNMSCVFPPAEGVEEVIKINWRKVDSPQSWTESMKRFYNKASRRLKYFDCKKILEEIKGQGTWVINSDDLFPRRRGPVKRCSFCRQTDHLVKECPKRFSNCYICGYPGHGATTCPSRMCLNCGEKSGVFVALCHKCEREKRKTCDECQQVGHVRSNCPDTWRRYHSTTTGDLKAKPVVLNENLMCCNCGKRGHLYEECPSLYWSSYPPTSFLVKNTEELNHVPGKRKSTNEVPDFQERNNKKRKRNVKPRYFHQSLLGSNHNTPNQMKKKKKSKSPHFKKYKNPNFNFTL